MDFSPENVKQLIFFLIDKSGSMLTKYDEFNRFETAMKLISSIVLKTQEMQISSLFGSILFNDTPEVRNQLTPDGNEFLKQLIIENESPRGFTALFNSIQKASELLIEANSNNKYPNAVFRIIVFSDGLDTHSNPHQIANIINFILSNNIRVDSIFLSDEISKELNYLTKLTGSTSQYPTSFTKMNEILVQNQFINPTQREFGPFHAPNITAQEISNLPNLTKQDIKSAIAQQQENPNTQQQQEAITQQQENPNTQQEEAITQQQENPNTQQQEESITQQQENPNTQQEEAITQQQENPNTQQQEAITQQQENPNTQQEEAITQQQEATIVQQQDTNSSTNLQQNENKRKFREERALRHVHHDTQEDKEKWRQQRKERKEKKLNEIKAHVEDDEKKNIDEFLRLTNEYRQQNGKEALLLNDSISALAKEHNDLMLTFKRNLSHDGFYDRSKKIENSKANAENCTFCSNQEDVLQALLNKFINDPSHQKTLLGDFNQVGIAIGENSRKQWFVTQIYAKII